MVISYELPTAAHVNLTIYDALGRVVHALVDGEKPSGRFQVIWDGRNGRNQPVASGIYLYRMEVLPVSSTQPIVLQRKMLVTN